MRIFFDTGNSEYEASMNTQHNRLNSWKRKKHLIKFLLLSFVFVLFAFVANNIKAEQPIDESVLQELSSAFLENELLRTIKITEGNLTITTTDIAKKNEIIRIIDSVFKANNINAHDIKVEIFEEKADETAPLLKIISQTKDKVIIEIHNANDTDTHFFMYGSGGVRPIQSQGNVLTVEGLSAGEYLIKSATNPKLITKIVISK